MEEISKKLSDLDLSNLEHPRLGELNFKEILEEFRKLVDSLDLVLSERISLSLTQRELNKFTEVANRLSSVYERIVNFRIAEGANKDDQVNIINTFRDIYEEHYPEIRGAAFRAKSKMLEEVVDPATVKEVNDFKKVVREMQSGLASKISLNNDAKTEAAQTLHKAFSDNLKEYRDEQLIFQKLRWSFFVFLCIAGILKILAVLGGVTSHYDPLSQVALIVSSALFVFIVYVMFRYMGQHLSKVRREIIRTRHKIAVAKSVEYLIHSLQDPAIAKVAAEKGFASLFASSDSESHSSSEHEAFTQGFTIGVKD